MGQILREFEAIRHISVVESGKVSMEGGQKLKASVENFVMETFLPQVSKNEEICDEKYSF